MNPLKGETPLRLPDGREFALVFGMTAIAAAEGVTGKPMPKLGKEAAEGFAGSLGAIFYGMLQLKHPNLSYEDAGDILLEYPDEVKDALDRASERGNPSTSEAEEDREGPNPRSKTSGGSGAKLIQTPKPSGGKPRARSN